MLSQPPLVSLNAEGEISRRRAFRKWELTSARFPSRVYPVGVFSQLIFFQLGFFRLVRDISRWTFFQLEVFPPGWVSPLGGVFDSETVQQYHRQAFNHVSLQQLPLRAEVRETRIVDFRSSRTSYRKCHWQRWMSLMSVGVEESEESHGLRLGVEGGDEGEAVDSWRFSLAMFSASACSICS